MSQFCIYKILSPSNDIYIGSTSNFKKRYWKHRGDFKYAIKNKKQLSLLQKSFLKYGFEMHLFEIILDFNGNSVLQDELEKHFIRLYAACRAWNEKGLNVSDGGKSNCKYLYSEGNKVKRIRSEEWRKKRSDYMKKSMATPEKREKYSKIMKALLENGKVRNISEINKGKEKKYKEASSGLVFTMAELSKIEGRCDSGIDYHIKKYGHYKNKYYPI